MKILVVGDSYCPSDPLRTGFGELGERHDVRYVDILDEPDFEPSNASERSIKEYLGSPRQLIEMLDDDYDVLVVQAAPVTDEVLDAAPSLKLIACARGGPVNIDLAAATARGIPVVTTPGKNAAGVAELTIAFMIMIARRLPAAIRHVEQGGIFGHDNYEGSQWFGNNLGGHTLGLIGFGEVGRRVVPLATAFGMDVLVFDPYVDAGRIAATGARPVELPALLEASEFVSIHARLTPDSRGMLDAAAFQAMRPGAFFVNTARAELIDEQALVDAVASGRLGGVALDISTPSPETGRHPLLEFPNVVIVPHIGGSSYETLYRGGELAAAEIDRFAGGEPLVNVANRAGLAQRTASPLAAS